MKNDPLYELLASTYLRFEIEEAARAPEPFAIEKQLTGAIIVRDIPSGNIEGLQAGISDDIKMANINAIKRLASKNIPVTTDMYQLDYQNSESGSRVSARFQLKYTGPKMKVPVAGVASDKEATEKMLQAIVKKRVAKVKLEALAKTQAAKFVKPVDVTYTSMYFKFVGRYSAFNMVFKLIPNKKAYGELALGLMPKTIGNIVIRQIGFEPRTGTSMWEMQAAGQPWLVKIGKMLDPAIQFRNVG